MRLAILLCGHVRSWNPHYFKQMFGQVDVYVVTYTKTRGYHPYTLQQYRIEHNEETTTHEDIDRLLEGIPKKRLILEDVPIDDTNCPIHGDTFSQYRTFKQCLDLCLKNGTYDVLIKTRFDITFNRNLEYILSHITDPSKIYISGGPSVQPCDQLFCGTPVAMKELANKLVDMNGELPAVKYSPHQWVERQSGNLVVIPELETYIIRGN